MNYKSMWLSILSMVTAFILTACASSSDPQRNNPPLNLIPMYGYPEIEKSAELKRADEDFINSVVRTTGSRKEASKLFSEKGWQYLSQGDAENAMRRFNQSWLLNPNYYQPYWGFGVLLLRQGKATEAGTHFEKALSLIDDDKEKPRLLTDTARAYSLQGATTADKIKSGEYYGKADSLFGEAIKLDPKHGDAYRAWARSLYIQGNYTKAWDMVKKSRDLSGRSLSSEFIDELSKKMPEP